MEQKRQSSFVSPRHTHRQLVQPSSSPGRILPDSVLTSSATTTTGGDVLRVYHFPVLDLAGINLIVLRYMPSSSLSREVECFQNISYFTVQICGVLSDNRRLPFHCSTPMQDGKAPLLWNFECPVFPILVACVDAGDTEEGNVRVVISLYYKAILVSFASLSLRGCILRGNSSGGFQFVDFDMWEPQVVIELMSKPILDHETTPLKERIDDLQRVLSKSNVAHIAVNEPTSLDLSTLCVRPVQVVLTHEDLCGTPSALEVLRLLDQSSLLVSVTVLNSESSSEICSASGVLVNTYPMILRVLSPIVSIQAVKETIFLNNPLVVDPIQELMSLFDSLFSENQLYADLPLAMLVVPFNSPMSDCTVCPKLSTPGLLAFLDSLSVFEVGAMGRGGSFGSIDFCWQLCFPLDIVHSDPKNLFDIPSATLSSVDLTFLTYVAPLCKLSIARCLVAWGISTLSAMSSELQFIFLDLMNLFDFFDLLDVVYDEWGHSFSPEWKAHCLMRLSNFANVLRSTANYFGTLPLSVGPNASSVAPQWQQRIVASAHRALLHSSILSKYKLQGLLCFVRKCLDTAWPKWIKDCSLGYIAWCEMKNPKRNFCLLSIGSDSCTLRHEWLNMGLWEHVSHKLDSHENVHVSVSNNKLVVGLSSRRKNGGVESENSVDGMEQSQAADLLCYRERGDLADQLKARVGIDDSKLAQEVVIKLREHGCNTWSDFIDIFELVKYERGEESSGVLYRNLKSFFIEDIHLPLIVAMKLSKFLVKFHMD